MAAREGTRAGGVRGHVWAPQTKVRRPDRLARYVARRSRAPYLRRWALIIDLASLRLSIEPAHGGGATGGLRQLLRRERRAERHHARLDGICRPWRPHLDQGRPGPADWVSDHSDLPSLVLGLQ